MSEDRDARIADYVLGLMAPEEAERFEREAARDPALARDVREGRERLHPLDLTARPIAPSAALWTAIERAVGGAPGRAAETSRRPFWAATWESVGFWRPVGLAGAAASVAFAALFVGTLAAQPPPPQFVAILLPEDGSAAGAIVEVSEDGAARLIPLRDIPVPDGRALEVWTLPSRERGPVSVGLVTRARSLDLALDALPPTRGEQLFEITLEPAAGSPVGRPTGPVLFKGLAARAL